MKRILRLFTIVLGLFILVACGPNYKEVDLDYDEAKEELVGIEVAKKDTLELELNLLLKSDDEEALSLKAKALMNNNDIELTYDLDANENFLGFELFGKGKAYITQSGLYLNGNLNIKSDDDLNIEIDGKYKVDDFNDELDVGFDIDELLDLDLDELFLSDDFEKLVNEYSGLKFYKANDHFKLELKVNKELVKKHESLFNNLEGDFIEDGAEYNLTLETEDKKLTKLNLEMTNDEDGEEITMKIHMKLTNKSLNLPNFDNYEDLDMDDFIN